MKTQSIAGIVLIILGVFAIAYQGFNFTTTEKAVDLGPIQISTEQKHTVPLPPIIGGIALVGGIALLVMGGRKN